jgi:hypothetical protein
VRPLDEVEAVIWLQAPRLSLHKPRHVRDDAMEHILTAIRDYAAGDTPDVTAARRAVLHRERTDIGRQPRKEASG